MAARCPPNSLERREKGTSPSRSSRAAGRQEPRNLQSGHDGLAMPGSEPRQGALVRDAASLRLNFPRFRHGPRSPPSRRTMCHWQQVVVQGIRQGPPAVPDVRMKADAGRASRGRNDLGSSRVLGASFRILRTVRRSASFNQDPRIDPDRAAPERSGARPASPWLGRAASESRAVSLLVPPQERIARLVSRAHGQDSPDCREGRDLARPWRPVCSLRFGIPVPSGLRQSVAVRAART